MKKKLKLVALSGIAVLVLTGCGRTDITGHSSGLWEQFVYGFAQIIHQTMPKPAKHQDLVEKHS
ncbi:MAG: hypothetical protein ACTILU_07040, partial [Pseudolactococcus laudensis]